MLQNICIFVLFFYPIINHSIPDSSSVMAICVLLFLYQVNHLYVSISINSEHTIPMFPFIPFLFSATYLRLECSFFSSAEITCHGLYFTVILVDMSRVTETSSRNYSSNIIPFSKTLSTYFDNFFCSFRNW